jgi:hypothetical protein
MKLNFIPSGDSVSLLVVQEITGFTANSLVN